MRSNEIFSEMTRKQAEDFLQAMKKEAPPVAKLAMAAAAEAFRLRPEFIKRQPRTRQAEWVRRALGRTMGAPIAEEVLATYFLEHRNDLLAELLDTLGVEHEEGRLTDHTPAEPTPAALEKAVEKFRKGDGTETRELLLRAFSAQASIDWPALDALLTGQPTPKAKPAAKAGPEEPATGKKASRKT